MKANMSRRAVVAAFIVAIFADFIEICVSPFFAIGFASPFDDTLDLGACVVLTWLLGWHLAFLPSFAIKLIPVADFAPTWTLAVLIASRHRRADVVDVSSSTISQTPPIIPEEKRPAALPEKGS